MQAIKWSFRASFFLALILLSWALFSSLTQRLERDQNFASRLPILQMKKKRLTSLLKKKSEYLEGERTHACGAVVDELMNMRLCADAYERLVQNADHPFSKGLDHLSQFIDRLYSNRMEFRKEGLKFTLVHPVYMETKDLEKMIAIIENRGEFAPLEVTSMKLMRKEILGGELWELSELICEGVDGNGVFAPSC